MSSARLGTSLVAVLLLTAAAAARADAPAVDVPALIDKLTDVADSDVGYSSTSWGSPFLPLDRKGAWGGGLLFQKPDVPSDTLRVIVKQGAAAVPHLVKHLDDKRPTKIKVKHDFGPLGGLFLSDYCDYNARTAKEDPNPKRVGDEDEISWLGRYGPAGGQTLTVGDLCFVALGQIVNRQFDAVRYQPTAIIIVSSPTESAALLAAVKKEWAGLTPERHKASLIDDFLKPDSDQRRVGACKRLAYYYPDALEPLTLKFLAQPTYDRWDVERFVHDALYRADGSKEIHDQFENYIAKRGEASRDGILLQLFDDLQGLEAKERGAHNASADEYGDKPRRLLVELYGKSKSVKSTDLPQIDTPSTGSKVLLIREGLIFDDSRRIDMAMRDLLATTDDDLLGFACITRLIGRGYDQDIEKYCRRRLPLVENTDNKSLREVLDKAGWTRLHTAVERGDVDEVRRRIVEKVDVNAAAKDGQTPLHLAAEAGDLECVQALLDGKAELNPKDSAGRTPVQLAAREDHEDVVLFLAEHGCELPDILSAANSGKTEVVEALLKNDAKQAAATNAYGRTPLHLAARRGQAKTAAVLLAAGAAVNAQDKDRWTPLHLAAAGGHEDVVRLLLENKADPNILILDQRCSPLHLAALSGKRKLVEVLIDHGADADIAATDFNGSPLHLAVNRGMADMVEALLDRGAMVDLKDKDGWAPLHLAAQAGREDVVRVLLDHKADVDMQGKDGRRALHEAAEAGHRKVVELLLDHKADAGARDAAGRTPLHSAAAGHQLETVALLLDKGADANARTNDGETALHDALQFSGGTGVVRILLEHKADARAAEKRVGIEPLHLAAWIADRKAVQMLLDQGAAVNMPDDEGRTPLHWAAVNNAEDAGVVNDLLVNGATVNAQQKDGSTPLHIAVRNGFVEAVKALLDHKANPTAKDIKGRTPFDLAPEKGKAAAEIKRLLEQAASKK
jgi:ankyrin repeat protein